LLQTLIYEKLSKKRIENYSRTELEKKTCPLQTFILRRKVVEAVMERTLDAAMPMVQKNWKDALNETTKGDRRR